MSVFDKTVVSAGPAVTSAAVSTEASVGAAVAAAAAGALPERPSSNHRDVLDPICTAPASGSGAEEAEAGCTEAEIDVDVDEVAELCVIRELPIREEI